MTSPKGIPRIESIKVNNYRALKKLEIKEITPLTVFLGPNGSGKSTVFDVFAFLSECFTDGLRRAWDRRGRFKELRSRNSTEPIEFELQYRERPETPLITYHLAIDENHRGPYVVKEWLRWKRTPKSHPFRFLNFENGKGEVVTGQMPDKDDERIEEELTSPDMLAVNTLGQLAKNPRVQALRSFITGWYLSYLNADNTRTIPESGPQEHLSRTGDNLANVIQYIREQHPDQLANIFQKLSSRVPRLEKVQAETTIDGRLVLQIKDEPFEQPIMAKFTSDGTLKLLAYLTVLYDPFPPQLIGIEEPENQLYPELLRGLADECRIATKNTQLIVTTHSPYFVDGLKPKELWVFYRDKMGYTQTKRAYDMKRVPEFINEGALLGDLWMEKHFEFGYPLTNTGGPKNRNGS